MNDKDAK